MIEILQALQLFCLTVTLLFIGRLYAALQWKSSMTNVEKPFVSVLIAARNEEKAIGLLLADLLEQDYPDDRCEVIIIDDGSTDRTAEIVSSTGSDCLKLISLDDDPIRSMGPKKRALTAGLEASKGEIILITDADCRVQKSWISSMVTRFDKDVQAVCGRVRFDSPVGFWGKLAAFEAVVNSILNAAVINAGSALSCAGANFAYRRSIFEAVGGYDRGRKSISGDDDLLLQKIRSQKGSIRFNTCPDATVSTSGPTDSHSYWLRKRRHLSAGSRYSFHWILLAAIIYAGLALTVLFSLIDVTGFVDSANQPAIWLGISLLLYLVFRRGLHYLGERQWRLWGLIASLFFPIVFTVIQPLTLFPAPSWKGRRG